MTTSTIPFSQVVSVVPSVLSAGGAAVDLNCLMLTQTSMAPYGAVLQFADAAGVAAYFGSGTTEAAAAAIYFKGYDGCTKLPGALYMTRYPQVDIAAFLSSGSLASMTLAQLQALSGALILTVNGVQYTSGTINLSSASSFSNAATLIQAGFTTPPFAVTFNSTSNAFVFTDSTTGAASTITYATGTLSTSLKLTQATGAVLSQGAAGQPNASTFMDGIVKGSTRNWATFMTLWEPAITPKEDFVIWSNANAPRFLYVCQDSDVQAKTANNTVTLGNYLQTNQLAGTMAIFGDYTHAAFACGWAASLDFTRLNGRATLCFKSQSGLVPSITNATDYAAILSNGYNCYGAFGSANPANNANWFTPGSVSGTWLWADTYVNQIWLNSYLQAALVKLLQAVPSIPYNTQGYGLIYAAAADPINAALNFGAIRKGVTLSSAQVAEIQFALGFDASPAIKASGFYLQIAAADATTRASRGSPPITLYYQDGESVQKINMASIAVQ